MQRRPIQAQRRGSNKQMLNTNKLDTSTYLTPSSTHTQHQQQPSPSYTVHKKSSGSVRLVYENSNGFTPWVPNNDKLTLAKTFLRNVSADCYVSVETRSQWDMLHPSHQLKSLFQSDRPLRTVTAHNKSEAITRAQEGGTALIMFDRMANSATRSNSDPLGRWCWTTFKGKNNSVTRLMVAYNPCKSENTRLKTVYSQHRRYFRSKGDNRCPLLIFRDDLDHILTQWIKSGDKIIIFIDANENLNRGKIHQLFKKHKMRDLVKSYTGEPGPATFHSGSNQIDGCFVTQDVDCHHAEFLPLWSIMGDHRGIIVDIPEQVLYGEQKLKIARPQARRLQCNRSTVRNKYNNKLTKQLINHKIPKKVQHLCSQYYIDNPDIGSTLQEDIDRIKKESMKHAEKKCRKIGMGAVPYSPSVLIWKNRRDLWSMVIRHHQGRTINRAIIKRKAKTFHIIAPLSTTLESAMAEKQKCAAEFERLRPLAGKYRRAFLNRLVKEAKNEGNDKKAMEIRAIIKREHVKNKWRQINRARQKRYGKSIDKVTIDLDGDTIILDTQDPLEDAIMSNNSKRFTLSYGSPLLDGSQLHKDLGCLADTDAAKQILLGTYEYPPGTDPDTISMLNLLAHNFRKHRTTPLKFSITTKDFIDYWKGRREATASSFSGLHFGHYKAASASPFLSSIHAKTIELAFTRMTPLQRWCVGLSVMIEKIPGCIKVDKLRALLFMEADFNFANKVYFGKRMIAAANKSIISKEQFAVKDNSSVEVALCRLLFFDIVRQRKYNAALGSYDAAQCYDCMTHSFISLAAQSVGTPTAMIGTMLLAIQCMQFHIRTAYGDSKRTYGSTDRPFQGSCQGNGAAPALWLLVSAYLIAHMRSKGHYVTITSAISCSILCYVGLWFVDDGDIPTFAQEADETATSVACRHQAAVTCWSKSLGVTGGALKPAKCFWYPMNWGWRNGTGYLKPASATHADITIQTSKSSTSITKLNPSDFKEVMGVVQNPLGQMSGQLSKLKDQVTNWLPLVSNGYLQPRLTYEGFWGTLWPALRYSLPCLSLTEAEADELMIPIYKLLLPKIKVVGNLPLAYRYGTQKYHGLCLPNFFHEQTIAKLDTLMMHQLTDTLTNQHLLQTFENLQLEVGVGTSFLTLPFASYGVYTTKCWLHTLWKEISNLPIKIEVNNTVTLPLLRVGDAYIMSQIVQLHHFSTSALKAINRVRLYHKCYALSHIVSGDGYHYRKLCPDIIPTCIDTRPGPNIRCTTADYDIWNEALSHLPLKLSTPALGLWLHNDSSTYTCLHDTVTNTVYRRLHEGWAEYSENVKRHTRSQPIYTYRQENLILPPNLYRGTYSIGRHTPNNAIIFEGSAPIAPPDIDINPTLRSILTSWGNMWLWDNVQVDGDGSWLPDAIRHGTITLVCDGSYQPTLSHDKGGAAWILECNNIHKRVIGYLPTTSGSSSAYRAELTGIYAGLAYLLAITTLHQITDGGIQVHCDNERAIFLSEIVGPRLAAKTSHADVLRLIRYIHNKLPATVSFAHIYGHQDDHVAFTELSREVQLNITCDQLAKAGLRRDITHNTPTHNTLPIEQIAIFIDGIKVTGPVGKPLRNAISRHRMRNHLASNKCLTPQAFDKVDWNSLETTMHTLGTQYRLWATKHVSGFCATNKMLSYRKPAHTTKCPCCQKVAVEDTHHQVHCSDPQRISLWNDATQELDSWLLEHDTEPALHMTITCYLRHKGALSFLDSSPRSLVLSTAQDDIGWDNFLEGKLTLEIRSIQAKHLNMPTSNRTVTAWTTGLISSLLKIIHSQWIYRNEIVHKRTSDGLKRVEGANIRIGIRSQLKLGQRGLDEEDKFLVKHTFSEINQWHGEEKKIWLCAIKAARLASSQV